MLGLQSRFKILSLTLICFVALIVAVGTGCPRTVPTGKAKVTTAFTADSGSFKNALLKSLSTEKAVVAIDDVYSLTVTIDEIALDLEDDDGEEEGDDDKANKAKVVVFTGPLDVNLLDLTAVSEALSTAEVPAGTYTKIRLAISNPRLALNSDPNTEITNIKLTANGHLFINQTFTLQDGEQTLLLLDFGGIHLVLNGNGRYVLTPQLQADLTQMSADVMASGEIANLDMDADVFTLLLMDGELEVDYSGAAIFLETDTDTATGTEADLADGLMVEVTGLLQVDGSVVASSVRILPAAP
ncbi:MAG: DUF4382 domain-containing protein [Candidatus Hydrogenedentes bacterium]|nr:DUF4382 domain-containing protein [Candidatus Hydrogenedentota bacterium]